MKYRRDIKTNIILIYRNKRKPIRQVREGWKNEDGCIACSLFDICLSWCNGKALSICEGMIRAGVIEKEEGWEERYFIDVPDKDRSCN